MAISLSNLKRTTALTPTIDLLYGPHGIGKTSFAIGYPDPVFVQTEKGEGKLELNTFGVLKSFSDVMGALEALYKEDHGFRTVVLDSASWLEPLIWDQVCKDNNWASIETPGFGKGYVEAKKVWRLVFDGLSMLRDDRQMGVVILAHADIREVKHPEVEAFDRFQPKLHKDATATIQEYADNVWHMNRRVNIVKDNPNDKNSRVRGTSGDTRILWTAERAGHLAKNRFSMPSQIILPDATDNPGAMFATVAQYLPYYKAMMEGATAQKTA